MIEHIAKHIKKYEKWAPHKNDVNYVAKRRKQLQTLVKYLKKAIRQKNKLKKLKRNRAQGGGGKIDKNN